MSIGFRATEEDRALIDRLTREGESTTDVLRRALRALDRQTWEEQARADMARLKDEDLSNEPDDWGDDAPDAPPASGGSTDTPPTGRVADLRGTTFAGEEYWLEVKQRIHANLAARHWSTPATAYHLHKVMGHSNVWSEFYTANLSRVLRDVPRKGFLVVAEHDLGDDVPREGFLVDEHDLGDAIDERPSMLLVSYAKDGSVTTKLMVPGFSPEGVDE